MAAGLRFLLLLLLTCSNSFGGIGIGEEKAEELAAKVEFSRKSSERWRETAVLIIDESK